MVHIGISYISRFHRKSRSVLGIVGRGDERPVKSDPGKTNYIKFNFIMSSGGDKQSDWVSPDPEADFNFQNEKQTTIDTDDKPEIDNEDESRIFMNILDGLACLVILLMISTVTFDCLDKSGLKRGAGGGGTSISSTFQSVVFVKSVASATSKAKRKDGEAGNFHVKSAQVCSHLKRRSFALSEALFPEDQYELFLSSMLRNRSRIGEYATKSFPAFSDISADLDNGTSKNESESEENGYRVRTDFSLGTNKSQAISVDESNSI